MAAAASAEARLSPGALACVSSAGASLPCPTGEIATIGLSPHVAWSGFVVPRDTLNCSPCRRLGSVGEDPRSLPDGKQADVSLHHSATACMMIVPRLVGRTGTATAFHQSVGTDCAFEVISSIFALCSSCTPFQHCESTFAGKITIKMP